MGSSEEVSTLEHLFQLAEEELSILPDELKESYIAGAIRQSVQ
jgi:hypothetical protein